jgi:hypothetical protein
MTSGSQPLGVSVGITNTGLGAAKRGIAVELALHIAAARGTPTCLVGADPTDRDVERRLPELMDGGKCSHMEVAKGPHTLDVAYVPHRRLFVVSLSDRTGVESVLPELRTMFDYVIIDAPSRVGSGVGIARVLLPHLDSLLIASTISAGDLALTRLYVDALAAMPNARDIDVGVVTTGHLYDSGLSAGQLERRLRPLPVVGRSPRLWGRVSQAPATGEDDLAAALRPVVEWVLMRRPTVREAPKAAAIAPVTTAHHVANRLYADP